MLRSSARSARGSRLDWRYAERFVNLLFLQCGSGKAAGRTRGRSGARATVLAQHLLEIRHGGANLANLPLEDAAELRREVVS
jgi:hypothetical protein